MRFFYSTPPSHRQEISMTFGTNIFIGREEGQKILRIFG